MHLENEKLKILNSASINNKNFVKVLTFIAFVTYLKKNVFKIYKSNPSNQVPISNLHLTSFTSHLFNDPIFKPIYNEFLRIQSYEKYIKTEGD